MLLLLYSGVREGQGDRSAPFYLKLRRDGQDPGVDLVLVTEIIDLR